MQRTSERGQAMVLVLGVCLICLAVGGLAVDGMRLILERRSLQTLADSTARAAATRISLQEAYAGAGSIRLDPQRARNRAIGMLRSRPLDGASVTVTEDLVVVEVRRRVEATFLRTVGIDAVPVRASAAAEPVLGEV